METPDIDLQALLGQLAADALVQDALLITLMELHPELSANVEARGRVAALNARLSLTGSARDSFDARLQDRWQFFADAREQ